MHPTLLATFFDVPPIIVASCAAGVALLAIGLPAARNGIARARGVDKILALRNLCVAIPLAVFGAEHLAGPDVLMPLVPAYMPWRLFWVFFVGSALIAASLSIATRVGIRWSGLFFGIMMFLFVAIIHLPAALARNDRVLWVIVFRELSFGGAGWILAGLATDGWHGRVRRTLIGAGAVCIAPAVFLFGVQHFLHPTLLPGVPLRKEMPPWIPGRALVDYVTGAALLVTGGSLVLRRNTRTVAAALGAWLLLMVVVVYGPVLLAALADPRAGVKLEGINYFADTLLFAGVILSLACTPAFASSLEPPPSAPRSPVSVTPDAPARMPRSAGPLP
jgi:uncharacterized membrane protein